jgi:alpha-ketoglutarate-dependent taurine dioxygenase
VSGVDLSRPLEELIFQKIREAFHRHLLLVFPDQHINEAQQIAFSRRPRTLGRSGVLFTAP